VLPDKTIEQESQNVQNPNLKGEENTTVILTEHKTSKYWYPGDKTLLSSG